MGLSGNKKSGRRNGIVERNAVNNSVTFADSVGSQPNAISFRSIVTATVPDGAGRGVPRIIADLVDQVGAHAAEAHARGADQAKHFSQEIAMLKEFLKFGIPMIIGVLVVNLALVAGVVYLIVWMLRALNVIS